MVVTDQKRPRARNARPKIERAALKLFIMETHNRLTSMMQTAFSEPGTIEDKVRSAVDAYCELADEDWLLFSFHLVSLNKFIPHDTRRDDDPVSVVEKLVAMLMQNGDIPKGDPAIIAAMTLGVVMLAGLINIYNRLPGPFSQLADTFTRTIMAILHQK